MSAAPVYIDLDIAIIGGGVAGLWLANRLKRQGFTLALFEQNALGSDQTMASQGMIHGGMKYTLSGMLTGASETIADMPKHWRACLCGEGDVDLRNTRLLSDHFYLWSGNSVSSKLSSFLASTALNGRVDPVPDDRRPPVLRHADFGGNLYKLEDIVLDVHSLVTNLAHNIEANCFHIDWAHARWQTESNNLSLCIEREGQTYEVRASRFIFCAGKGNRDLLASLGLKRPAMQLRPLQQVMVKHKYPYSFYGHCLGAETTPRLTISSHKLNSTDYIWYLGGSIAEKGASLSADELIIKAQLELAELLPWVDMSGAEWKTLPVQRAEPLQPNFLRPENAFVGEATGLNNLLVAWPTKLTLAPNLANQVLDLLKANKINPASDPTITHSLQGVLPHPPIAATPWEIAFPPAEDAVIAVSHKLQDELSEAYDEDEEEGKS
ncbi:MAG: FAD-dependent oxidoreductase [Gammaproteobacteria bacterium]|nr:MAG: FAD-dependent oxidoreductase [Gammaproteobacteria bacterium]